MSVCYIFEAGGVQVLWNMHRVARDNQRPGSERRGDLLQKGPLQFSGKIGWDVREREKIGRFRELFGLINDRP